MNNELIATEVMGWDSINMPEGSTWVYGTPPNIHYVSSNTDFLNDMNAAMRVVEKMRDRGYKWKAGAVENTQDIYFEFYQVGGPNNYIEHHKSLPSAICTAARSALNITH